MKIFKSLQAKFISVCMLISGFLLLLTFSTILVIINNSAMQKVRMSVESTLEAVIKGQTPKPSIEGKDVMIAIYNGDNITTYRFDFYTDEMKQQIIETTTNTTENKFHINDQFFYFQKEIIVNKTIYAITNYTEIHNMERSLWFSFMAAYIAILLIVCLISAYFARIAVKPVKDAFIKQRALIANASHELKTPLTIISTNLDIIENKPESKVIENTRQLSSIMDQIDKMKNMISEMLELSSIENNNYIPHLEDFNFSNLCKSLLLSFEANFFIKKIFVQEDITLDLIYHSDKKQIEKLLLILIDNAIKYTPENGQIIFALSQKKKQYVLSITNTGNGIKDDEIKKIFDRFYRVDDINSTNSYGLGLSIAQLIVKSLHGEITCKSIYGESTTFTIILPN